MASVARRHRNLLNLKSLKDTDVPLMVCATGLVFKACPDLLKSVFWLFQSFAVTDSVRRYDRNQELCIHLLCCLVWMESCPCSLSSESIQTPADLAGGIREWTLFSIPCHWISCWHQCMPCNTLVAAIWPEADEFLFYDFLSSQDFIIWLTLSNITFCLILLIPVW